MKNNNEKINEAIHYLNNAINFWVELADYEDKKKDIEKTDQALDLLVKLARKGNNESKKL